MIRRKTRLGILVLATLAALSYWAGRSRDNDTPPPIEGLDTRLNYALQDFELRFFDEQGAPSVNLTAPALTTDASTGVSQVENPRFEVKHLGDTWNVEARTATISANRENILMSGDVWMRRDQLPPAGPLHINTSELMLEVLPRVASSERPVRIEDGLNTMEAVGFRVNIKDNTFELLNRVKVIYAVN